MPKKNQVNAFSVFTRAFINDYSHIHGRSYPGGFSAAMNNPELKTKWDNLSSQEKEEWKEKAREEKLRTRDSYMAGLSAKATSISTSSTVEQEGSYMDASMGGSLYESATAEESLTVEDDYLLHPTEDYECDGTPVIAQHNDIPNSEPEICPVEQGGFGSGSLDPPKIQDSHSDDQELPVSPIQADNQQYPPVLPPVTPSSDQGQLNLMDAPIGQIECLFSESSCNNDLQVPILCEQAYYQPEQPVLPVVASSIDQENQNLGDTWAGQIGWSLEFREHYMAQQRMPIGCRGIGRGVHLLPYIREVGQAVHDFINN